MKVLRPPPEFKGVVVTCRNCTAELECEFADFKRSLGGDQRDSWDHAVATCAACSSQLTVDKSKFPNHIYERLPRVASSSSYFDR